MSSIPASLSHPFWTMATMDTYTTRSSHNDVRTARSPRPAPRPLPDHPLAARSSVPARRTRPPRDPQRVRVYRRRRAVALIFAALVVGAVVMLAFVGGRASADGSSPGEIRPTAVYVVRSGDTLWDIATALAPDRDPRIVVAALERSAGGSSVYPGQRIVLPASLQR